MDHFGNPLPHNQKEKLRNTWLNRTRPSARLHREHCPTPLLVSTVWCALNGPIINVCSQSMKLKLGLVVLHKLNHVSVQNCENFQNV